DIVRGETRGEAMLAHSPGMHLGPLQCGHVLCSFPSRQRFSAISPHRRSPSDQMSHPRASPARFILRLPHPVEPLARDAVLSQKDPQLGRMFLDVAQGVQLEHEKAHRLPSHPGESNPAPRLLVRRRAPCTACRSRRAVHFPAYRWPRQTAATEQCAMSSPSSVQPYRFHLCSTFLTDPHQSGKKTSSSKLSRNAETSRRSGGAVLLSSCASSSESLCEAGKSRSTAARASVGCAHRRAQRCRTVHSDRPR